jgi:stage III sporulation protein AH
VGFKKRQIVLASLVVALGAAVYLNWQFSPDKDLNITETVRHSKELGQASFVDNKVEGETQESAEENAPKDYFETAKEKRKQAHEEATETLKETLSNAASGEKSKAEAIKQSAEIAKIMQSEANIESLIKAKGIGESVVFINGEECSVVVAEGTLNETSAVSIRDIVLGQGGVNPEKIKMVEAGGGGRE